MPVSNGARPNGAPKLMIEGRRCMSAKFSVFATLADALENDFLDRAAGAASASGPRPIIGPGLEWLNDHGVAGIKSRYNGDSYAAELARQQAQTQCMLDKA